jgi:hypothetical protein
MWRTIRSRLSYANVASSIALFLALSTGAAYAANTVFSSDIVNGEVKTADIAALAVTTGKLAGDAVTGAKIADNAINSARVTNGTLLGVDLADGTVTGLKIEDGTVETVDLADGSVETAKVQDGAITSAKVLDDTNAGGGLGPQDLASSSVGSPEIATDAVAATEIQNNSIDAGEIVDFGLANEDVGVLFAEVNADATLANSGSNAGVAITSTRVGAVGAGTYEVDFGRTISQCTAVATLGTSGTASQIGEVNVADRSGNSQAVFVDTNNSSGAAADKAFRLVVVC